MKKIVALVCCCVGFFSFAESEYTGVTDVYKFTMAVKVPRIYDNNCSLGYRKYQGQKITGYLNVKYPNEENGESGQPEVTITDLVNNTHKINGCKVTYEVTVGDGCTFTRVNLIGNNKTDVFKTPSVCFTINAEPSYSIGGADEDNSLICTLAGSGSTSKTTVYEYKYVSEKGKCVCKKVKVGVAQIISRMSGYLAGTMGCGCKAYGHVSPTRVNGEWGPTDQVDDVAAIYGTWSATYYKTLSRK